MNPTTDFPVIVTLVNEMAKHDGWCGETHIQKTSYFLKRLLGVPLTYDFIMYKHGPYSFNLHDDLAGMRAKRFLKTEPRYPYGPSYKQGRWGKALINKYPEAPAQYKRQIDFVATELGGKGVMELERLATAMFITLEEGYKLSNATKRARLICALKPHVPLGAARAAVQGVDDLREKAKEQKLIN